jgi:hypothetical protein
LAHLEKFMPPPGPQPASRIYVVHHNSRAVLASAHARAEGSRDTE